MTENCNFILFYHPLASFCWKPLIALYESNISFTPHLVDLGDEHSRQEFLQVWPMGQFPVLRDTENAQIVPQSTIIIEYLAGRHAGARSLIPAKQDLALEVRRWDQFYDTYVQVPMQKIVGDCLRPAGESDAFGVRQARETLRAAYRVLEDKMARGSDWSVGDAFTLADCSAAAALFYADKVEPFRKTHQHLARYFERLLARPSFVRVLKEAEPYFPMFPYKD